MFQAFISFDVLFYLCFTTHTHTLTLMHRVPALSFRFRLPLFGRANARLIRTAKRRKNVHNKTHIRRTL